MGVITTKTYKPLTGKPRNHLMNVNELLGKGYTVTQACKMLKIRKGYYTHLLWRERKAREEAPVTVAAINQVASDYIYGDKTLTVAELLTSGRLSIKTAASIISDLYAAR